MKHEASFAILGKDTRVSSQKDSPYGSWWFRTAHHVTPDVEKIGPLYLKAGIRKANSLDNRNMELTEKAIEKWKMTATTLPGWGKAFKLFESEKDSAKADAQIEKELKEFVAKWPSVTNAMIYHETAKWGYQPAPEAFGMERPER